MKVLLCGLIRTSEVVNRMLAQLAGGALLAIMVILVSNIAVRQVADPINGTYELVSLAAVIVFGLSIGYGQSRGAHASIDLLVIRWPKRVRVVVGGCVGAASAALFVQLATSLVVYGMNQRANGVATELFAIPTWPWVLAVAFGVGALALALIADVAKAVLAGASDDPAVNIF